VGRAASMTTPPASIGSSFYNNPDWFDDVGDGPVTATIEIPGNEPEEASPAWVITAPPDFAPPANGIVTLYDVIKQMAIDKGWLAASAAPSFETDIKPMIERASSLQHVDEFAAWSLISQDWEKLGDTGSAQATLRRNTALLIRQVENALHDFEMGRWQIDALEAWVDGDFDKGPAQDRGSCDALTRAALDGGLGQGFFPGIEAGVNIVDPTKFDGGSFEFRLLHDQLNPGDLTALMALPWQADFLKCGQGWWPAQRPFRVTAEDGVKRLWLRPSMNHQGVVKNAQKLGVLTPENGRVVEKDRDPSIDQDSRNFV
jgi:L-lysine epsilon oxidase C-terminal domain/L-Lysine epsilon oxidase N-terminal